MPAESPHFKIRLPAELKAKLEQSAADHGRSVTADILWRLEQSFRMGQHKGEMAELFTLLDSKRDAMNQQLEELRKEGAKFEKVLKQARQLGVGSKEK